MIRQRTYDEIRQSIRSNINDANGEVDTKAGTFVSDVFVCPQAQQLAVLYSDLKLMEMQQCITTASGYDLDRLGFNYFVFRNSAKRASGYIRFYISGTNKNVINKNQLPQTITIPKGFQVSSTNTSDVVFTTQESIFVTKEEIYQLLPRDANNNYKYVEASIKAQSAGSSGNCDAGTITTMYSGSIDNIVSCSNFLATTGGEDQEADAVLRYRIMLAVRGASICTKGGYEKFMLEQDNVEDVLVVGAGDKLMFRDGGYLTSLGEYVYGRGGMVDIWIRGKALQEVSEQLEITSDYLNSSNIFILEHQPVTSIVSIVSETNPNKVLENANKYDVEYSSGGTNTAKKYYMDVIWDFGITDAFTDTQYYNMNVQDITEIEMLRQRLNKELTNIKDSMANIDYGINWYLQHEEISEEENPYFTKITVNGILYKVICNDYRLDGREFVKKNDKIYERLPGDPDYELVHLTYDEEDKLSINLGADLGGSYLSTDCVHWLKDNILFEGEIYNITYNYNQLIYDLQSVMSAKRILTADILVREAVEVPIQVGMTAYVNLGVDNIVIKNILLTQITTYINFFKTMGGTLEESELAAIARRIAGVTMVDLDTVYITRNNVKVKTMPLTLAPNEYFNVTDLSITVLYANT